MFEPPGLRARRQAKTLPRAEAEESEGLHIGSPEMLTYFDHFGYPTAPAKPDQIFSSPDSTVQRLGRQVAAWEASR